MSAALDQNLELLRQGIDLLERIDDELYGHNGSSAQRASYSVGPHLRHCVDAYSCLLAGLAERRIDYDARQRQSDIETARSAGHLALAKVFRALEEIRSQDPHLELRIKVDTPFETPGAWSRSTLRRELQFLVGHTIHHFALIALILRRAGFEPGVEFGVAPSTLRHWAIEEAGALEETRAQEESGVVEETVVG